MSGHRHPNDDNQDGNDDDNDQGGGDSHRKRRRIGGDDEVYHSTSSSTSASRGGAGGGYDSARLDKFQLERQERMARLRQQLQEEDEELDVHDHELLQEKERVKPQEAIIEVNQDELEGLDEEEQMKRLLGFDGFGSTKGEAVQDNQNSAARGAAAKNKARKYRQYMNRKNGFNRPLEKMD